MLVLCLLTCLVAVCQSDSAISDCSVKCSSDCQCPCQSVNTKPLWKYTKMRGKGLYVCIYITLSIKYLQNSLLQARIRSPQLTPPVCLIPLETTSAAGWREHFYVFLIRCFFISILFLISFRCINGGQQCGFPMQKWCQNPKSKKVGRNFWRMRLIGNSVHISLADKLVLSGLPRSA